MRATTWPATLALGISLPWLTPVEPGWYWLAPPLVLALLWSAARGLLLALAVGFAVTLLEVHQMQQHQVPSRPGGFDLIVSGRVASRPLRDGEALRFDLLVDSVHSESIESGSIPDPRKLRVSWYQDAPALVQGQRLTAELRVKSARGLYNPGLFDYGSWLISRGYHGSAYVRNAHHVSAPPDAGPVGKWRLQFEQWLIEQPGLDYSDLLLALGIGEQRHMSDARWRQLEQWGLIHLMVISGLHVGFAALLGQRLCAPLARLAVMAGAPASSTDWAALAGLCLASFYAALAGFTLPTQRALLAVFAWYLMVWMRWRLSPLTLFCWVLVFVLMSNPGLVMQQSLWMSFGAVGVLILSMEGVKAPAPWLLLRVQLALLLAFSALLLLLGKPVYPMGALYNLVAVPVAGLLLVPLLLVSILLQGLAPVIAAFGVQLVDWGLGWLFELFALLSLGRPLRVNPSNTSAIQAIGLLGGSLMLLWLRRPLLLLPWFVSLLTLWRPAASSPVSLSLHLFDVGQGTAILLQQPGYALLYDAGPSYPSGFDAGADILVPWMEARGIRLDALVISHSDRDHIGGYQAVHRQMEPAIELGGPGIGLSANARPCLAGQSWRWRDVSYRVLYPEPGSSGTDNNLSCVLLVQWRELSVLLTGDIEAEVEAALIEKISHPVEWLLVPHHGSRTSSTAEFVRVLKPSTAVVTAGWGNSYGHPVAEVLQRYEDIGAKLESTALAGMLEFYWYKNGSAPSLVRARNQQPFWWMSLEEELICSVENKCGRRYDR